MCMIEGAEPYHEVAVPIGFTATACTECRQPAPADLTGWDVYAGIMGDTMPDRHAWLVAEQKWLDDHAWHDHGDGEIEWRVQPRDLDDPEPVQRFYEQGDGDRRYYTYSPEWLSLYEYVIEGNPVPAEFASSINVHVACPQCLAARKWLIDWCDGWCYDMVAEDIIDHWSEGDLERHISLGRLVILAKRGWRDRRGILVEAATIEDIVNRSLTWLHSRVAA